jgi:hypothetical protein
MSKSEKETAHVGGLCGCLRHCSPRIGWCCDHGSSATWKQTANKEKVTSNIDEARQNAYHHEAPILVRSLRQATGPRGGEVDLNEVELHVNAGELAHRLDVPLQGRIPLLVLGVLLGEHHIGVPGLPFGQINLEDLLWGGVDPEDEGRLHWLLLDGAMYVSTCEEECVHVTVGPRHVTMVPMLKDAMYLVVSCVA